MQNKLNKAISVILIALLLIPLFLTGIAAEDEIVRVELFGIRMPVSGETPSRSVTADDESVQITGVEWLYSTTPDLSTLQQISGKFGDSPYYAVRVTAEAKDGKKFADDPDCVIVGVELPIQSDLSVSENGKSLTFTHVFGSVTAVLHEVAVTGFRVPLPGETPCGPGDLTVSEGMNADQVIWTEKGEFKPLSESDRFEEGKVYEATVWLKGDGSAIVTADTKYTVGKLECKREYWDENTLCLKLSIPCEAQGEVVLGIEVIKDPDKIGYKVGEELDLRGLVVRITTSGGFIDSEGGARLTASPTVFDQAGPVTVTLECEGVTTTFDVIVLPADLKQVSSVKVTDLVDPVAGRKANNHFTLVSDPEGAVTADGEAGTFWYWFGESFSYEPFEGKFEEGQKYALWIPLSVEEGYDLTSDAEFTVNGSGCVLQVGQKGELVMVRYYDELPPAEAGGDSEIGQVDLRGVVMPERAKNPVLTGITAPDGAHYTVTEIGWVVEQDGAWIATNAPFAAGHYGLRAVFHAEEGYVFDDPTALLNGASANAVCTVSGRLVTVLYDVCRLTPGEPVVTDPPATDPADPRSESDTLPPESTPETSKTPEKNARFPVLPLVLVIVFALALGVAVFFLFRKPEDEE